MASRAELLRAKGQKHQHDVADPHVRGRWLSDVILGAQDGVVNTLGVVLGVAAASGDNRIVLASGLAAGVAESLSMAAVAYTSSAARGDLFRAERAREYRHVESAPDVEREEVRALYARKGFSDALLERVVDTICANKDVWVAVMMAEEHALADVPRRASLRAAAIVGVASLAGAIAPVLPFAVLSRGSSLLAALIVGTVALCALGALKARITTGRPVRNGVSLAVIGIVSALAGYAIGSLFGAAPPRS
jgi:vacuolar iron transporter family protein